MKTVLWIIAAVFILNVVYHMGQSRKSDQEGTSAPDQNTRSFVDQINSGGTDCSPRDFQITNLQGHADDGGFAVITGIIVNHCNESAGVQLQYALYGKNGDVVDTDSPWPASVSNIPAGDHYPFKITTSATDSWDKYSVRPIAAKRW